MRIGLQILVLMGAIVLSSSGEARSHHGWDQASTGTAGALATLAVGLPLIKSDEAGLAEAGLSMAAGTGTSFALKWLVHELSVVETFGTDRGVD